MAHSWNGSLKLKTMVSYIIEELRKEDCTLFILGKDLENIEKKKLMFPTLSHA